MAAGSPEDLAPPAHFGAGLRILVVDDEPETVAFLGEALASWGFAVATAASRGEALAQDAGAGYDVVLVDKNLPDGNGLELARALTRDRDDCAVVIMSGYANLSSALEAIQMQVAEYLTKPFDLGDFAARLQRVVEHQALRRRHRALLEELARKNALLESLAARDVVTALFNHAHFQDAVQRELARSAHRHLCFALVLLDLDGFRRMNAAGGHAGGDAVLAAVGALLERETRRSDLVARHEKDTFALLLPDTAKASAAAEAERLRRVLAAADFSALGGDGLTVSASVAAFPDDGATREELLTAAQLGLRAAKGAGGDCVIGYHRQLARGGQLQPDVIRRELERRAALERTIAARAFGVVYQPLVHVPTATVMGYEALCRPRETSFGSPTELFAAAERAGRVAALGRVVRALSVTPFLDLPPPALLFLNVHPHELSQAEALEGEPALRALAGRLVLEITEGAQLDQVERAHDRIVALRACGFRVAVDDLGAGYASLNRLAGLAPDYVKLDMDLIRGLSPGSRAARLIAQVIAFCHDEGVTPIAEGVETAAELQAITELGVELAQGFYLARPAPPFVGLAAPLAAAGAHTPQPPR